MVATTNGYYKFVNMANGLTITPNNHSTSSGTGLILWYIEGNSDQEWNMSIQTIQNKVSGFIMASQYEYTLLMIM